MRVNILRALVGSAAIAVLGGLSITSRDAYGEDSGPKGGCLSSPDDKKEQEPGASSGSTMRGSGGGDTALPTAMAAGRAKFHRAGLSRRHADAEASDEAGASQPVAQSSAPAKPGPAAPARQVPAAGPSSARFVGFDIIPERAPTRPGPDAFMRLARSRPPTPANMKHIAQQLGPAVGRLNADGDFVFSRAGGGYVSIRGTGAAAVWQWSPNDAAHPSR